MIDLIPRSSDLTPVLIDPLTGIVDVAGEAVALTLRERELITAIAIQPRPISVDALCALLYPERQSRAARNAIKVYAHRLRRRIATDVVVHGPLGYAIGQSVKCRYAHPRAFAGHFGPCGRELDESEFESTLLLSRALRARGHDAMIRFEWYASTIESYNRVGRDVAISLARWAYSRMEYDRAISVARELTYDDTCDEEAWEVLLRAQLELGRRTAASHGFRKYRAAVASELGVPPSPEICALF